MILLFPFSFFLYFDERTNCTIAVSCACALQQLTIVLAGRFGIPFSAVVGSE